jgi:hypothetical protein
MTPEEEASLTQFIRELVDTAPPLTPEVMAQIRQLMPPVAHPQR